MIDFPCKCGHRFSVEEDQAGGDVQCPECRRLVAVPFLGDAGNLDQDGTYKMGAPLRVEDEHAAEEMKRAYLPRKRDDEGDEYDLRPTPRDISNSGVETIPLKDEEAVRPGVLKYDPETGDLIRPMRLKQNEERVEDIPVAKAVLGYATGHTSGGVPLWRAPMALLMPGNISVIAVVFLLHMVAQLVVIPIGAGLFFLAPGPLLVAFAIMAHYANVVDEVGCMDRDELPGVLRGMSWSEDIWRPFVAFFAALMICYLPALLVFDAGSRVRVLASLATAGVGTLLFPGVLLTTATSGSVPNLRPDRVLRVILTCGASYVSVVLLWAAAGLLYAVSVSGVTAHALTLGGAGAMGTLLPTAAAYAVLLGSVYLMHLFTWQVGMLYRAHQPKFPWVWQHHEWSMQDEKELRELRRLRQEERRAKRRAAGGRGAGVKALVTAGSTPPVRAVAIESVAPVAVKEAEVSSRGAGGAERPAKRDADGLELSKEQLAGAEARLFAAMERKRAKGLGG